MARTVSEATAPLTLTLFGPMQVRVQGRELPRLHSRKAQWLLALLALRQSRPVEREWLAGTLWPDADQEQAFANLRPVLSDLRRALGSESERLRSPSRHSLRLELTGAEVDVLVFDAAIADGTLPALTQAVTLYTGPLLEGCTEEWVEQERAVREQACLRALGVLANASLSAGDYGAAAEYFRRAVVLDPWQDAARRGLMEALAQGGDRNAALQAYREFTTLLRSDPRAAPDEKTSALYARLRAEARQQTEAMTLRRIPVAAEIASPKVVGYLPHPLTDLVGRENERLEVTGRLRRSRLVTLTGPGGIGKTRLALEVAAEAAPEFADGVWLVALEALTEGSQVAGQVAGVLGLKEEVGRSALQTLTVHCQPKHLLLVLDNCEHLLEASAQITMHLLRECAGVRFLVTSREALGITGETVWSVPALTVPNPASLPAQEEIPLKALAAYESVTLFIERAQAVQKTFALTRENARSVAQVCFRLEGLPLAIELAAARVKVMTAAQIASRLDDRLGLLTGGSRTALSRQQTLRATLDWSSALLNQSERCLLRRLSVFTGGWTLAAAEQVCAGPEIDGETGLRAEEVLDRLTSLVDKSLVAFEERTTASGVFEGRYRLLETVRQYAAERLEASGEASATRASHRDYFLAFAEEAERRLTRGEQADWLVRLEAECANLRAALEWCRTEDDGAKAGLRLAGALGPFWEMHGDYSEGRALLSAALGREGADGRTPRRAKALRAAGMLAFYQRDYGGSLSLQKESLAIYRDQGDKFGVAWSLHELGKLANIQANKVLARSLQEEGLALFRELGDKIGIAWSLHELGRRVCEQGDYVEGKRLYEEGLALFRELGNRQDVASSLNYLGKRLYEQGDYARARALHEEGLVIFRELDDRQMVAWSLHELGKVALGRGDYARARALHEEGLAVFQELENRRGIAWTLHHLGDFVYAQGDYAGSRALHEEGLVIFRELGDREGVAWLLNYLGKLLFEHGDYAGSDALHEEGLVIFRELDSKEGVAWSLYELGKVALVQGRSALARDLFAEGVSIQKGLGDRRGVAICLRSLAAGLSAQGNISQAVRLWGAAEALCETGGEPLPPSETERYHRQVAQARSVLGEDGFESNWEMGRTLTWEQAADYAIEASMGESRVCEAVSKPGVSR